VRAPILIASQVSAKLKVVKTNTYWAQEVGAAPPIAETTGSMGPRKIVKSILRIKSRRRILILVELRAAAVQLVELGAAAVHLVELGAAAVHLVELGAAAVQLVELGAALCLWGSFLTSLSWPRPRSS